MTGGKADLREWDCAHPLCGRLLGTSPLHAFDARGCSIVGTLAGLLTSSRSRGDLVLLGEVHDSAAHHGLRALLLRASGEVPARTGLVFEHLRPEHLPVLDAFMARDAQSRNHAGDLLRALEWEKSGWPKAELFEPLFAAAIDGRFPLVPGDPPRAMIRKAAKEGPAALPDNERARLRLDAPLPDTLQSALLEELTASHCGLLPRAAFGNMAFAQRYRDAHLAHALVKAADEHGSAILLAGNGHVRSDRGVPFYLRQMAPGRKVVSVMLVEVEEGKTEPEAYIPRDPGGRPAADYVVLTPRTQRPDPCEEMRRHFAPKAR